MTNSSSGNLDHLLALAREYDEKYRQMEQLCATEELGDILPQLIQQVELATDRFRYAQQVLFRHAGSEGDDNDEPMRCLHTVSRCFDEVLIVFHALIDKVHQQA